MSSIRTKNKKIEYEYWIAEVLRFLPELQYLEPVPTYSIDDLYNDLCNP